MATVTTIPALVLPDKPTQFVFTGTAGGNLVKVWCTSAPRGSKLREQLDSAQSERVVVISESDIGKRPQYMFDVGGAYVLQIEEFTKGAEAYGGRYRNDPDGHRTETLVASVTQTISVASRLEVDMGVAPDRATLQVYVSGSNIVATTPATHGFASPAIVRPATDRSRAASDSTTVVSALNELGNTSAVGALGTLRIRINNFISQFNAHIASATAHDNADTDNGIEQAFEDPRTVASSAKSLAECVKRFHNHIQNVDPSATNPSPGSADYHEVGGSPASDWANLLIAGGGSTASECEILFADLARCFTAHVNNDDVHNAIVEDYLDDPPELTALHMAFLAELAALAPTAPPNEHAAKVLLVSGAGFKEV